MCKTEKSTYRVILIIMDYKMKPFFITSPKILTIYFILIQQIITTFSQIITTLLYIYQTYLYKKIFTTNRKVFQFCNS